MNAVIRTKLPGAGSPESDEATQPPTSQDASLRRAVVEWRRRRTRNRIIVRVCQVLLLVLIFGGWEVAANTGLLNKADLFYGKPSGVYRYLVDNRESLWTHSVATVKASLTGFTLGAAGGILVGLALGRWSMLDRIFDPFLAVLAGLPRIALAPLFLLWFGISDTAKVAVSISAVFFVVLFNARAGVRSVQPELQTVAQLLGARQRDIFRKVILPGSVPVLFAGLRLGMIFSVLGVIASEMVAARKGLGVEIVLNGQTLQPNGVFACLAILAFVMSVFNGVLQVIERRLLRWLPASH